MGKQLKIRFDWDKFMINKKLENKDLPEIFECLYDTVMNWKRRNYIMWHAVVGHERRTGDDLSPYFTGELKLTHKILGINYYCSDRFEKVKFDWAKFLGNKRIKSTEITRFFPGTYRKIKHWINGGFLYVHIIKEYEKSGESLDKYIRSV